MENDKKKTGYDIDHLHNVKLQVFIIILGVFMAILDTGVVNVAIPKMEIELSTTTADIQWVLTAYMLTIGVLVPLSGWMTDKFGPKKLFLFALITFTLGSALCGMAWNLPSMIFFRIIQGIGGGFMMPVSMAMIYRIFPPEKRGIAMGFLGIAITAAPAFGPALSGYLVEYASWRLIFYINVPIGLFAIILGFLSMHEFSHSVKGKLDIWGAIFSTVGFFSLLYGFSEVSNNGWGSQTVDIFLGLGVLFLILLVITELRVQNPLIQLRIFKNYMFTISIIITSLINIALFAGIFLLPIYLQNIMGYSAIRAGLFMTPGAIVSAIIMPFSGRLFDKIGAKPLALFGLLVIAITTYGFTTLTTNSSGMTIQLLYILRSVGMGITMMPIMTAGMNTIPKELTSQGTAITNTVRQVASSLGTAVLTSYFATQTAIHMDQISWSVTPDYFSRVVGYFQSSGVTQAIASNQAFQMIETFVTKNGFVDGMNDTFFISTLIIVVAWLISLFMSSKKKTNASTIDQTVLMEG